MAPKSLVPAVSKKPIPHINRYGRFGSLCLNVRDQFSIATWLCLGASLQLVAYLFISQKLAIYTPLILLAFRLIDTLLMTLGLTVNRQAEGVIYGKYTAQIPDEDGNLPQDGVSNQGVCVLFLGSRTSHPLGMIAPGYKEVADRFMDMQEQLNQDAERYGYLGSTLWKGSDRARVNEVMIVLYFRNLKGIHDYSLSPLHRDAWQWWNKIVKTHPHLGIMHEIYDSPKHHWENIWINYPSTGIGATTFKQKPPKENPTGQDVWMTPLFDASRGKLKTSHGRLSETDGTDNDKFGPEPYEM